MVNVKTDSGDTEMLTMSFQVCENCAAFKLHWIFPNGGGK